MKENLPLFGRLNSSPWPRLLFQLWQKRISGYLELRLANQKFHFWFSHGNLLVMANSLPLTFLQTFSPLNKKFDQAILNQAIDQAKEKGEPVIRFLSENTKLNPEEVLNWYLCAWKEWFYEFFDLNQGEYFFESLTPDESSIYAEIFTPEIILEGIRQMKNFDLITGYLPDEKETFQIALSSSLSALSLTPAEKYFLRLISTGKTLAEIYGHYHLGRRQGQRALFTFLVLEIIIPSSNQTSSRASETSSWKQLDRILSAFSEKCLFIFRFMSKEIGPIAWHVLQKSIEDVRPYLSPTMAQINLLEDGRLELPPSEKLVWFYLQKNFRQTLIRDLNEILMAQILAVKRTLGSALEATLIENLEKIGNG
ncbi:MAG: DUF4388 domain-containing protein [Candidatus Aminicenantes bacterium]|nr:DUF4388 domain-containing protein [Candidatus Aminicenantes bacterium]